MKEGIKVEVDHWCVNRNSKNRGKRSRKKRRKQSTMRRGGGGGVEDEKGKEGRRKSRGFGGNKWKKGNCHRRCLMWRSRSRR